MSHARQSASAHGASSRAQSCYDARPVSSHPLAEAFIAACPAAADRPHEVLDGHLRDAFDRASERWPAIELEPTVFAAWVGARSGTDSAGAGAFASLCTDDLYLACACVHGNAVAIAHLHGECFGDVDAALRAFGLESTAIEDIRQQVIDEIVVARPERGSGLSRYGGVGVLRKWFRTIAVRMAAREARGTARIDDDDALRDAVALSEPDPDLEVMRSHYREAFGRAFAAALAALSTRERNLLRQSFIDGLGIDALANLYGIHRSTAARWVASARQALGDGTIAHLVAEVGGSPAEMQSLLRVVHSQLDVSVRRLLGTE